MTKWMSWTQLELLLSSSRRTGTWSLRRVEEDHRETREVDRVEKGGTSVVRRTWRDGLLQTGTTRRLRLIAVDCGAVSGKSGSSVSGPESVVGLTRYEATRKLTCHL